MNNKQAYTLVELVVVVGVLGLIMSAVVGILVNAFRAKNKVSVTDVTEQVGSQAINELKNDIISALGVGMTCTSTPGISADSLTYTSSEDGGMTTLTCVEGAGIASASANGSFDLTGSDVKVSGCNNFARCVLYPGSTDRVSTVNFSFTMSSGTSGAGGGGVDMAVGRKFQSTVTVRN